MYREWKQAYKIASLELKASLQTYIILFIFNTIFFFVAFSQIPILEGGTTFVGDILFILAFLLFPSWMRPKELQLQKINGELWAAPTMIMLQQLPILRNAIVKSRFILYFFMSFPLQAVFLISVYLTTPEIRDMHISPYIAFAIIWLSIGIYIGYIMPASDGGGIINWKSMVGSGSLFAIIGIGLLSLFHGVWNVGIVEWTISIAQSHPILSIIVSILLAFLGYLVHQNDLKRTMKKLDYL